MSIQEAKEAFDLAKDNLVAAIKAQYPPGTKVVSDARAHPIVGVVVAVDSAEYGLHYLGYVVVRNIKTNKSHHAHYSHLKLL
jgi:hypothetical protein